MKPAGDSGEALGLSPARLTMTFGFGAGLFVKDGQDRYGLAAQRPAALVDLPRFNGDQLVAERSGGDLSIQACADDPQVAFHAVRQLARLAYGVARDSLGADRLPVVAGAQGETPRNLMGFKDGTRNRRPATTWQRLVWVGEEGPAWMRGGSYLVVRRIRIALEHWDRTRDRLPGAGRSAGTRSPARRWAAIANSTRPTSTRRTRTAIRVIPENAHVRLAARRDQ